VFAILLAAASSGSVVTPLAALNGTYRVFIVSAPSSADPDLARQDRWLRGAQAGLRERDVMVIRLVGHAVDAPVPLKLDVDDLRRALGLRPSEFGVALVGKDGAEAFRRRQPATMPVLFGAIDAMPMRQQEMRQRGR
jgi:hypothetical protein